MATQIRQTIWILASCMAFGACVQGTDLRQTNSDVPETLPEVHEQVSSIEEIVERQARSAAVYADRTANLRKLLITDLASMQPFEIYGQGLRHAYEENDFVPVFTTRNALTPAGIELTEQFIDASRHGLVADNYHVTAIIERITELRRISTSISESLVAFDFDQADRDTLSEWLVDRQRTTGSIPTNEAVAHLILSSDARSPLPRFAALASIDVEQLNQASRQSLELELLLAGGFLRWASDIRFSNHFHISEEVAEENGWDLENPETMVMIAAKKSVDFLTMTLASGDFVSGFDSLSPAFEQYGRLLAGVDEYRKFVQLGGWGEMEVTREMEAGRSYPQVRTLRRRLAAENYWSGDLESTQFDDELSDAVLHYQTTHQLRLNGDVDEFTISSLSVPAERRLAQIQQTLRRWHVSRLAQTQDEEYIVVNLPDFHAELWDGDELVYRWVTIVGKLRRSRDSETGEMRMWGATPLFSDEIEHVVFNPYWNVPGGIFANEYIPKIEEDPEYLEEHNFEILVNEVGNRFLRQKPGPENALGLVKFLFPNEEHIYLHDTNRPSLFQYNIRAFSHGCIRVENALELAAILLSRDREQSIYTSRAFIRELIERGDEQWIGLRKHLAIHLDYYAVRGDEDGRIHFLADVYRLDRDAVDVLERQITERTATMRREAAERLEAARLNQQRQAFERTHRDSQSSATPAADVRSHQANIELDSRRVAVD